MSTILIPTIQQDIHAAAVAMVLEEMGHRAVRWFCQDLPEAATASFFVGRAPARLALREGTGVPFDPRSVDVFWHRRVADPIIQGAGVVPCDRKVARNETRRFLRGLMLAISERSFAVNDYQSAQAGANKLYQLQVARALGLAVPETLISNDPEEIKTFLRRHQEAGTIFKSFQPVTWDAGSTAALLYTHKVTLDRLPDDQFLQLSPGIFQAYVPKAFEVRATFMGGQVFAARLDSQVTQAGTVDWRLANHESLPTSELRLPDEVADQCRALMRRLGLVFGCFDFIVTPQGQWVFLEVNQMGQFLWVEEATPEIPLLQMFCDFLVQRDPGFRYHRSGRPIAFADVIDEAASRLETAAAVHQRPATPPFVYADA